MLNRMAECPLARRNVPRPVRTGRAGSAERPARRRDRGQPPSLWKRLLGKG
jgi:hypothetical protein